MDDQDKTKEQLLAELAALRQRVRAGADGEVAGEVKNDTTIWWKLCRSCWDGPIPIGRLSNGTVIGTVHGQTLEEARGLAGEDTAP